MNYPPQNFSITLHKGCFDEVVVICLPEFRERNAVVAQRWAELSEEERKEWGRKAEVVCSTSVQVHHSLVPGPSQHGLASFPPLCIQQHMYIVPFLQEMSGAMQQSKPLPHLLCSTAFPHELNSGEAIIEKTLLSIQEKVPSLAFNPLSLYLLLSPFSPSLNMSLLSLTLFPFLFLSPSLSLPPSLLYFSPPLFPFSSLLPSSSWTCWSS